MPGVINTAMCLNVYDAGWDAIAPTTGMTPDGWFLATVKDYLERTEAEARKPFVADTDQAYGLDLRLTILEGVGKPIIAISTDPSTDGGHRLATSNERRLRPYIEFLGAVDRDLAQAVLSSLTLGSAIVTPEVIVDHIQLYAWMGEDDESVAVEEYIDRETGECQYDGITRKDVDETYPMYVQRPYIVLKNKLLAGSQNVPCADWQRLAEHHSKDVREALALVEAIGREEAAIQPARAVLFNADKEEELLQEDQDFLHTLLTNWDGEGLAVATFDMMYEYAMQGGAVDYEPISLVSNLADADHVRHLLRYLTGRQKILVYQSVLLDRVARYAIEAKRREECQSA